MLASGKAKSCDSAHSMDVDSNCRSPSLRELVSASYRSRSNAWRLTIEIRLELAERKVLLDERVPNEHFTIENDTKETKLEAHDS